MRNTVKVGDKVVPVRRGRTKVYFSAGEHGRKEAGWYCFWTVVLSKGAKRRIWGRARAHMSPAARFNRMAREMKTAREPSDRAIYAACWRACGSAIYIRPTNARELCAWFDTHATDACFASKVQMDGKRPMTAIPSWELR